MNRLFRWVRRFIRELRRRRVIRVTVVYAGTAFVILQLGEILVEPFGLGDWTLRLITLLLVLGFPLAVGLAWVFDVTEEGLVRTEGDGGAPSELGPGGKPFTSNGVLIGLLVVAIGLLLYPRVFSSEEGTGGQGGLPDTAQVTDSSIAVLPFEALSPGQESKTFARGVHDDLLTRLSNVSGLQVISRTSVEQYRDTDLSLPAIADSLGAQWVMEGGVLQAGGQIQVNAQLIDPRTDTHIWAEDYRRKLTAENLFAIQSEITKKIARSLETELTPAEQERIERQPTGDLEAYQLYVQGRSQLDTRTEEGMRQAVGYFRRAIEKDSSYALAWAGLADAIGLFKNKGYASPEDSLPAHERTARRALELGPNLAEAHASMGLVHLSNQNGPAGLRALERAVQLKPSYAQAQHWLGWLYLHVGRPRPAREHLSLAVELTPQNPAARVVLAWALLATGAEEKAMGLLRQRGSPGRRAADRALLLYHTERWDELERLASKQLEEGGETGVWRFYLTRISALRGDTARARRYLAEVRQLEASAERRVYEGALNAAIGAEEAAFRAWRTVDTWPPMPVIVLRYLYPDVLSPLREDPRYENLLREVNRAWGLEPDGGLPSEPNTSITAAVETDE